MRRVALLACFYLLASTPSSHAQSPDQALNDFRTHVLNQRLILQNFIADPVVNFEWTAAGLVSRPPKLRTVGIFTFRSANLQKDRMELTGSRSTFYQDKNKKPTLLGSAPILVTIALKGADPTQVLAQLSRELFYPTPEAAFAAVPVEDRKLLSLTNDPPQENPSKSRPNCPAAGSQYVEAKALHIAEPEFSDEARSARFSGSSTILLTVDESGRTTDLWLQKPAGLGLDEQAAKAVSNYIFKPATCDGVAVKTSLFVEVNFRTG
jgi:TonB family protein